MYVFFVFFRHAEIAMVSRKWLNETLHGFHIGEAFVWPLFFACRFHTERVFGFLFSITVSQGWARTQQSQGDPPPPPSLSRGSVNVAF